MLDPDLVIGAVVAAIQSIPEVVTEMGGTPSLISGHYFRTGDNSIAQLIHDMTEPSVLVVYVDQLEGKIGAMGVWKHRLEIYVKTKNAKSTPPGASMPHLLWLLLNKPVLAGPTNLRYTQLLSDTGVPGGLMIMDTPTLSHRQDETLLDYWCATLVFPEWGDA